MDDRLKKILKGVSLELRHLLEGKYDFAGIWQPGDLETRLASIGIWRDRKSMPSDELSHLDLPDTTARKHIDAFIKLRAEAGISHADAVAEYIREAAYTWANRLITLRCMESRQLIDEVIIQKSVYGNRSLEHHRLKQRNPELCMTDDEGFFEVLKTLFDRHSKHLPLLFDPTAPTVALRPSVPALNRIIELLSGQQPIDGTGEAATSELFSAQDALGWAYQFWNTEEKDRIFERSKKGVKIEGADIVPATQLYTYSYMVKFLIQNSLGSLWMAMYPSSRLFERWEYYVARPHKDTERKSICDVTIIDPACGSGHFLLEAFDLLYEMYEEEGKLQSPSEICTSILHRNLFGLDIDERAIQIAEAGLWMKACEKVFGFEDVPRNLLGTNFRLPHGLDHLQQFLDTHPQDKPLQPALETLFNAMEHADELGSLLNFDEPVELVLREIEKKSKTVQLKMLVAGKAEHSLPAGVSSYHEWKTQSLSRLKEHFANEAVSVDLSQAFFGRSASKAVKLFEMLSQKYDVVVTNPPYMGFKKSGPQFVSRMKELYPKTYQDLYTAFTERSIQFIHNDGFVGLITLNTWLSLIDFADARDQIFSSAPIDVLCSLGTGTFRTLSNTNAMGFCMFVLTPTKDRSDASLFLDCSFSSEKQQELKRLLKINGTIKRSHQDFDNIPGHPIAFGAPDFVLRAFAEHPSMKSLCRARQGLKTGDNPRFLRFVWECPTSSWRSRWFACTRGGPYRRWRGNYYAATDWENDGARLRNFRNSKGKLRSRPQNIDMYFKEGITWTTQTSYGLSVRKVDPGMLIESAGPLAVPNSGINVDTLLGIANCRIIDFFFNLLQPNVGFGEGYFEKIPAPILDHKSHKKIAQLAARCVQISRDEEAADLDSAFCSPHEACGDEPLSVMRRAILSSLNGHLERHCLEAELEKIVLDGYGNHTDDQLAYRRVGKPVATFPCIEGLDDISVLSADYSWTMPSSIKLTDREIENLRNQVQEFYERGPTNDTKSDEIPSQEEEELEFDTTNRKHPTETFLELISRKTQTHPLSIYLILKEGIIEAGWRCPPEESRRAKDILTVQVLRLFGHQWPCELANTVQGSAEVDLDGIIPLTPSTGEDTLVERMRSRLATEFPKCEPGSIDKQFGQLLQMPWEEWLNTEFFKFHASHASNFKKRPLLWQLQSSPSEKRRTPAFAGILYYQRLNGDTLHKISSHYAGTLRLAYESEFRTIESISADRRTDRQEQRYHELDLLIDELKAFESSIRKVIEAGFQYEKVDELLAGETIDSFCSIDGIRTAPTTTEAFVRQEIAYTPDLNDGVRINIAPLQRARLLAANVLAPSDEVVAIADRAVWRADERRWCREGILEAPGWWTVTSSNSRSEEPSFAS